MTYVKINEEMQTIEYPPINKDNICNYNVATDLLEADGYVDIEQSLIDLFNQGKGKIENNNISDISQTPEYKAKVMAQENAIKKSELQAQIDELDKKRVRAICEPSIKDETTGQTWLDYYNEQMRNLRNEIAL